MRPRQRNVLDLEWDVREGLTAAPKSLPSRLLYDAAGSAIFEEITRLPEYYLTRTEEALFAAHADEMISRAAHPARADHAHPVRAEPVEAPADPVHPAPHDLVIVELGAGSGRKTKLLLRAVLARQCRALFVPLDVSRAALDECAGSLSRELPHLDIEPIEGRYRAAVDVLRRKPGRKLVLWIGSSIGNYEPPDSIALLRDVRSALAPGDALLLGTDLRKSPELLVPAYDDAAGVTARFNLNLLARLNRELGADFDLSRFKHVALWNERASRMESYLESLEDQIVRLSRLDLTVAFTRGERLHTENSYKFTLEMVDAQLSESGFAREKTWTDANGWFAEHLARAR